MINSILSFYRRYGFVITFYLFFDQLRRLFEKNNHSKLIDQKKIKIAWILNMPMPGSGGYRNIFRMIYNLPNKNFHHFILINSNFIHTSTLNRIISKYFYNYSQQNVEIFNYHKFKFFENTDIIIPTFWNTTELIERKFLKKIVYFVQDYEPFFYPISYDYVRAFNSYNRNFYFISSGKWVHDLLKKKHKLKGSYFDFPIERKVYRLFNKKFSSRKKRIIFFAVPENPRRLYQLGFSVLERFSKIKPDYEIIFFGSKLLKLNKFRNNFSKNLFLEDTFSLAELYNSALVGIAFSSTNPSLVPIEMMSCGLPVIDADFNDNKLNYDGREDLAILSNPDEDSILDKLLYYTDNLNLLENRSKKGLAFSSKYPSELKVAEKFKSVLINHLNKY